MHADDEPLLNPRQAAKLAHVSEPKLRLMLQHKELHGYKIGKQWRIRKSQLIKWIQTRKPTGRQRSSPVAVKPS
jgi:excisionase family DNA binding protein